MSKVIKGIANMILILAIAVLMGYLLLKSTGQMKICKIETGSMEEVIHVGDYVLMFKTDDYEAGDIVTYTVNNYYVTHRITNIDGDIITTKGDANNLDDEVIDRSQIEGKVIYHGGILNIIINYKFAIIAFLVGLYLLSGYFGKDE